MEFDYIRICDPKEGCNHLTWDSSYHCDECQWNAECVGYGTEEEMIFTQAYWPAEFAALLTLRFHQIVKRIQNKYFSHNDIDEQDEE